MSKLAWTDGWLQGRLTMQHSTALLVDDPLFGAHRARETHPERPERLEAARRAVRSREPRQHFTSLPARDANDDELGRVHDARYLDALDQTAGLWSHLDADTFVAPESARAARRAAGGAIALTEALLEGRASWGVALLRPPGHHARRGSAMGFCLLNNVAAAAAHARARGAERVLVLDWDVHHGNGTQEMFYDDPSVLYVSLHQFPYYPGTGAIDEVGHAEGRGFTVNVPLRAGADDATYRAAFERIVCPVAEAYRPSLTLVSAGFDAHARDPLGGMLLSDAGYFALTHQLRRALPAACPLGFVLEGGYDLRGLEGALGATLDAMTSLDLPELEPVAVPSEHEADLQRAEAAARAHWQLG